jgi:hypothetical protein
MSDREEMQKARVWPKCACEEAAEFEAPWPYMGPWHAPGCRWHASASGLDDIGG